MSTTGATREQIEAAAEERTAPLYGPRAEWGELDEAARYDAEQYFRRECRAIRNVCLDLVPPGSAIIDAEDVAAIRRAAEFIHAFNTVDTIEDASLAQYYATFVTSADLDRLRRIGDEG